jgi:toxin ParE1/3/4
MSLDKLPQLALTDVDQIVDHYLAEAVPNIAARFLEALELALGQIQQEPGIGSPRLARAMQSLALRIWPVKGFPYLIFYLDLPEGPQIWRVLHTARDIPSSLRD